MKKARLVFGAAGTVGLLMLLPLYGMLDRVGRDHPPAITHPEFFYGFLGVAVAWQVVFLIIARDPIRHRVFMIPAVIEKFSFGIAALILQWQGRIPGPMLAGGILDLVWGTLFVVALARWTSPARSTSAG